MEENFSGNRYYIFDGNPIKTIWEDGIILNVYSFDSKTKKLHRNDGLAFYVETEVSEKNAITEEDYLNHIKGLSDLN